MLGRPHVGSAFGIYKESAILKRSENHHDITVFALDSPYLHSLRQAVRKQCGNVIMIFLSSRTMPITSEAFATAENILASP